MKKANWFNLVYLILSTTTKFIFCFVTTLVILQFFACVVTVPLIFLNAKNKATGKHKLPSHSTNNLKPKKKLKPCGQSSIKAFYKGLPGKKGKSSIITSTVANKYAVVRSFDSSSFVGCSVNSSFVTKNFDFYSELVFPRLEMKVLQKKFLLIN